MRNLTVVETCVNDVYVTLRFVEFRYDDLRGHGGRSDRVLGIHLVCGTDRNAAGLMKGPCVNSVLEVLDTITQHKFF